MSIIDKYMNTTKKYLNEGNKFSKYFSKDKKIFKKQFKEYSNVLSSTFLSSSDKAFDDIISAVSNEHDIQLHKISTALVTLHSNLRILKNETQKESKMLFLYNLRELATAWLKDIEKDYSRYIKNMM